MLADRLLRRAGGVMNPRQMAMSDEHREKRKRGRDEEGDTNAQDLENEELVLRYGDKINESSVQAAASKFNRGRVEGAVTAGSRAAAPSTHTMKLRDQKQQRKELARERVQEDIRRGDEFSSGKGQGDVKRGKLDPFAYVPLNRRFMNKRHSRQAVQRFEAVSTKTFKGNKAKMVYEKK
jgi:ribosomal RNA-processing protein 12